MNRKSSEWRFDKLFSIALLLLGLYALASAGIRLAA